ncbi:MAG: hypothetical protein PHG59_02655 [Patescibacteria group bacterium]|nr:hypothetical protein [Patescibacteria group bacterium]
MKKMNFWRLVSLQIICFFLLGSCAKWEVLSPNANGELALRVQNVEICFLYKEQKIEVYNKNWESCWVNIARLETWSNYYSIFDRPVGGRNFVSEKAFFESGDKIQIKIYLDNSENEKTEIYSYFRLGKVVYDGDETNAETIEFHREGEYLVAEITL